ncbi:MAG: YciI family protein [Planctomycetota bacterium]
MLRLLLVVMVFASASAAWAMAQPTTKPEAAPPMAFDTYRFVLLAAAEEPPEVTRAEAGQLQRQHLGHLRKMAEAGHILVAGPFMDRFDQQWRGLVLYRGDLSIDEVRELAEADPSVQAGLMRVEVMTWVTEAGAMEFPTAVAPQE